MKKLTYFLIVLLLILHQDYWWWDSKTIVLGVLPVGLAYHLGFSVASALLWALALKTIWPSHWEQWADEGEQA